MTETEFAARKESRLSVRQVVTFIVTLVMSAALMFIGLSWGMTYMPIDVQVYEILPNVVCPSDETELRTVFDVDKPRFGNVETFSVNSTWIKEGGPDRIGLPETSFPFGNEPFNGRYGHHDNISPA